MTASKIESALSAAAGTFRRVDGPRELPAVAVVDLVLVDWGSRQDDWGSTLRAWRDAGPDHRPAVILFGPHTDLEAHRAAKAAGLGPMRARSALFSALPRLLDEGRAR